MLRVTLLALDVWCTLNSKMKQHHNLRWWATLESFLSHSHTCHLCTMVVAVEFSRLFCWTEGASMDVKIYNSEFLHC